MSTNERDPRTDLRARRTRHHLRGALLELMAERGYDAVTVVDICERAMVHRTTFYKHYPGKPELLDDVLDERLAVLMAPADGADPATIGREDGLDLMRAMVRRIDADRRFYRLLARREAASLLPQLTDALRRRLLDTPVGARATAANSARAELRAHLHASLIVHAIVWWLRHDAQLGPEDLADVLAEELTARG